MESREEAYAREPVAPAPAGSASSQPDRGRPAQPPSGAMEPGSSAPPTLFHPVHMKRILPLLPLVALVALVWMIWSPGAADDSLSLDPSNNLAAQERGEDRKAAPRS